MFQPYVLFKACSHHKDIGKGNASKRATFQINIFNSPELAEGEGVTATSLGRPKGEIEGFFRLIHRVPSVEGATATSLGNFKLLRECKKINRKNTPNELFPVFNKQNQGE